MLENIVGKKILFIIVVIIIIKFLGNIKKWKIYVKKFVKFYWENILINGELYNFLVLEDLIL